VSEPPSAMVPSLTTTERQIIGLLPSPLSFAQMAQRLDVSPGTVRATAITLYRRMGVVSRAEAVERALVLGLAEQA